MKPSAPICPKYQSAIELLGKRWTGLLLHVLLGGPRRFGELASALGGISERVLSERLKELERQGVLLRLVSEAAPVRVEYRLTAKGQGLSQVVEAISGWAEQWVEPPPRVRRRAGQA